MGETVEFELVTPERLMLAEDVDMVVIPGSEGDFGVLPEHSPMISTVRPGVVNIYRKGAIIRRVFVSGGFTEVGPERCTLLAEKAMDIGDINRDSVNADLADAQARLRSAQPGGATAKSIERKIRIAEAMLAAAASVNKTGH
ncbi:MAG: ATP synthase F1 subunit epsilon [Rhodospirillales bacterium RIFCSPLOWO2_12_FULL_58_28]|nr:MAG: ATP synthase F1 subunit epsilon [Rhodospirillales bacterium RIFCSPLOWO2_02_FULL_58_16]OHC78306.1 MAG: ATP synthase F1 subunit epsilon [Rhodospirillales bacterium RIFCSPLOWO2_12_FULL_58_28]